MANSLDAALASYLSEKKGRAHAYPDLHDHLRTLVENDLLYVIQEPVNKDTQMHPLVRWQYRGGIDEYLRKAFLFLNPTDSKGRQFDGPVLIGALAGSQRIYELGFGRELDKIGAAWMAAIGGAHRSQCRQECAVPGGCLSGGRSRRAWSRTTAGANIHTRLG